MKKIINDPVNYTDDMLRGIYAAHPERVCCAEDDLRCYCTKRPVAGKVAIITGGGTGHLPLFLGYVGENLLDGCAVGGVFQSPSAEQIFNVSRQVEQGAGVLYLYGNYTGDIMNFDMAAELCEMEGIETRSIVGADDIHSAPPERAEVRRGVAGIYFMYKCAGAKAAQMGTLDEVLAAAQKAKERTRTVGFALSPCIIPEIGHANFTLAEGEMAMGMGIHGEPGIRRMKMMPADEMVTTLVDLLLEDSGIGAGDTVCTYVNGLGSTTLMELHIMNRKLALLLAERGIHVHDMEVNSYVTTQEMAGASVTLLKLDEELRQYYDAPCSSPYYKK